MMTKEEIHAAYEKKKRDDHHLQKCAVCGTLSAKKYMDPHHPKGRAGVNKLQFIWVHRECHDYIHKNPKLATERGWLTPNRNIT